MTTDQLPEQADAGTAGRAAVTVRDLRISTTSGTEVVHDVSLRLAPGIR